MIAALPEMDRLKDLQARVWGYRSYGTMRVYGLGICHPAIGPS
jgi:hypothetical protein